MSNKSNQVIAIARFLAYKSNLNKQLENMTEEQYYKKPVGLEVGSYIQDMMKYCPEQTVDIVLKNQSRMIERLSVEYLSLIANMEFADGSEINAR